jgi:hypothetical protein
MVKVRQKVEKLVWDMLSDHIGMHQIKNPYRIPIGVLELKPGSDLLSHGETPHYHRRRVVSLPSSVWDRVVPTRYGRQANWFKT